MIILTKEAVQAIRERAEKATPGPWVEIPPEPYDGDDEELEGAFVYPGGIEDADGDAVCVFGLACGSGHLFEAPGNPAFIAASRADVPALCDTVEALRVDLDALKTEIIQAAYRAWPEAQDVGWDAGHIIDEIAGERDSAEAKSDELAKTLRTLTDAVWNAPIKQMTPEIIEAAQAARELLHGPHHDCSVGRAE